MKVDDGQIQEIKKLKGRAKRRNTEVCLKELFQLQLIELMGSGHPGIR